MPKHWYNIVRCEQSIRKSAVIVKDEIVSVSIFFSNFYYVIVEMKVIIIITVINIIKWVYHSIFRIDDGVFIFIFIFLYLSFFDFGIMAI